MRHLPFPSVPFYSVSQYSVSFSSFCTTSDSVLLPFSFCCSDVPQNASRVRPPHTQRGGGGRASTHSAGRGRLVSTLLPSSASPSSLHLLLVLSLPPPPLALSLPLFTLALLPVLPLPLFLLLFFFFFFLLFIFLFLSSLSPLVPLHPSSSSLSDIRVQKCLFLSLSFSPPHSSYYNTFFV